MVNVRAAARLDQVGGPARRSRLAAVKKSSRRASDSGIRRVLASATTATTSPAAVMSRAASCTIVIITHARPARASQRPALPRNGASTGQSLEVRRAAGQDAGDGAEGALLAKGRTSAVISGGHGVEVFAGVTADQFAGDASALESFEAALAAGKYTPEAFENHSDFFHPRHVAVIVVQVPTELIGVGLVHGWATVSLHGHAPDVQVARWGLPSSRTCSSGSQRCARTTTGPRRPGTTTGSPLISLR